jgi:hypothetical protein
MASPIADQDVLPRLSVVDSSSVSSPGSSQHSSILNSDTSDMDNAFRRSVSAPRTPDLSFRSMLQISSETPQVSMGPNSRFHFTTTWPDETARTRIDIETPKDEDGRSINYCFEVDSVRPKTLTTSNTVRYHCSTEQLQNELLRVAKQVMKKSQRVVQPVDLSILDDPNCSLQGRLASAVDILTAADDGAGGRRPECQFIATCKALEEYWQAQDRHSAYELCGIGG